MRWLSLSLLVSSVACSSASNDKVAEKPQTLALHEVVMLQTVKVALATDGVRTATRNAPVVADREGLLRLMLTPGPDWVSKRVHAALEVVSAGGTHTYEASDTISDASADDDIDSSLQLDLPREAITIGATYNVTLTGESGEVFARFPEAGSDSFDAVRSGPLKVEIVPVRYHADGSGRLPDVSPAMLETYRSYLRAMYPVTDVSIDVHAPYDLADAVGNDGSGWSDLLNQMVALRASDRAEDDVYYYGLFVPDAVFSKYCNRGCVTGLSGLVTSATDPAARASIGVGYANEESAKTMAHEIGHAHGRPHAPCGGPAGVDKKFPYAGGKIGPYGWNAAERTLVSDWFTDVMGYCTPVWISDYTYAALHKRVSLVNASPSIAGAAGGTYRVLAIDGSGKVTSARSIVLPRAPLSAESSKLVLVGGGSKTVSGSFVAYDHLPGGMLFVRESELGAAEVERLAP